MRNFKVFFPERVPPGQISPGCSCGMVACGSHDHSVVRGVTQIIAGNSKQDVWERMRRKYPFERIEVTLA